MNVTETNKKELSTEQREELLRVLKARFEKNMHRHKGLEWAKVRAKLEAQPEKLWSLNEMEKTGGNRMLCEMKGLVNTFSVIVRRRILKVAEVFVTTAKRRRRGKNINQKITLWIWQLPWGLNC